MLRSHQNVMSRTPTIVIWCCLSDTIQCCLSDTIQCSFIPRYSTCKVHGYHYGYFIVTMNNNCINDISKLPVGPRVCQLDFLCVILYIFKNAPDNFFPYVAGYYHISWKTSLKSYKKVQRQNQLLPPTKEGASIKHHRV